MPDVWGTLGGWLNAIKNNESPTALPMPFVDGKTETLPPVPVPEGSPQQGQEQPLESQNLTLKLTGSQVEMAALLTGTEGCASILPQVNSEEWDAHVRAVCFSFLFFPLPILRLCATILGCTLTELAASVIVTVVIIKGV